MRWRLVLTLAAALAGASPALAAECPQTPIVTFGKADIEIASGARRHRIHVEVATNEAQRSRGLMCRTALAADAGMLFDYGSPQPVVMWMKNTLISLDMLFVEADGTIAGVAERTVPESEAIIPAPTFVRAVIELPAGTVARLGLRRGDRIIHPMFAAK